MHDEWYIEDLPQHFLLFKAIFQSDKETLERWLHFNRSLDACRRSSQLWGLKMMLSAARFMPEIKMAAPVKWLRCCDVSNALRNIFQQHQNQ